VSELVSILIPAFNAQPWLGDAIGSALAQSWPRKEVIVVDDGSTDDTLAVARGFAARGVKVFSQANQGAAAARNTALRAAQGTYIQYLDADDLLHRDKVALQLRGAEHGHLSRTLLTGAWGRFFVRHQHARFAPNSLWRDLSPVDWLVCKFSDNRFMFPASWLVSRRLIDAAGPWNEDLSLDDDGEYSCRLVAASQGVSFVADARCAYRVGHAGSLSSRSDVAALCSLQRSLSLCISHLLTLEDSPRTRAACVQLLQDNLGLLHPEQPKLVAQCQTLAYSLGGTITLPRERMHVHLFRQLFGHQHTRLARHGLNLARLQWRKALEQLPQFAVPHTGRHPSRG
jgi:hypothetical protein